MLRLTFLTSDPRIRARAKAGFFMAIGIWDVKRIGTVLLLLAFVAVAIFLPADAPPAVGAVTFTLILILEILFAFSLNPQQLVSAGYRFGIPPRSPPIC
jgi:hypothetical protein